MTSPSSSSVSVALATFDGARFVEEQLASILSQSVRPIEVVVADDGSTDATLEIVRRVAESAGPTAVRILPSAGRLGVAGNFARALAATTGDLVLLSDQDDRWHDGRVAAIVERFESDPTILAMHGDARLIDATGAPIGRTLFDSLPVTERERESIRSGRALECLISRNLATGATMAVRRSLIETALPVPEPWIHDEWLAIVAAALGGLAIDERALVDYRQHGGNEIGVAAPTFRYRLARMLEPRGDRMDRLAERSVVLAERLGELELPAEVVALVDGKAEFERERSGYPAGRIARLPRILRAARGGRYGRFSSQGALDIVRDLVQPA